MQAKPTPSPSPHRPSRLAIATGLTLRLMACCAALALPLGLAASPAVAQDQQQPTNLSVDDSPAAIEQIEYARALEKEGRHVDAVRAYQGVIEQYGQRLRRVDDRLYTDIRKWVQSIIREDDKLLETYRRTYDASAMYLLEEASRTATNRRADQPADDDRLAPPDFNGIDGMPAQPPSLELVMQRFFLCDAGLEAGLRLAGIWLERGHPAYAGGILDELANHPNLDSQRDRWNQLQAAVGLFANERNRLAAAVEALRGSRAVDELESLKAWATGLDRPAPNRPVDHITLDQPAPLPDPLGAPLWQVPLPPAQQLITIDHLEPIWGDQTAPSSAGDGFRVLPIAMGDQLLLHLGSAMASIDRSSGQANWIFQPPSFDPDTASQMGRMQPAMAKLSFDPRAVATDGSRVFGVLGGIPLPHARRWLGDVSTTLVCVDAATGEPQWEVEPDQLDPSLANAFFHGTPVLNQNRIFVLARRTQGNGVHDAAFLIAVDANTGKLQWRRHLSSVLASNRNQGMPLTQITDHPSGLFVADQLGAAARVDTRSGGVDWLRLLAEPQDAVAIRLPTRRMRNDIRTMPASAPVLVEKGLVVARPANATEGPAALLLNADTGELIEPLAGEPWDEADLLLPSPFGVIAIGNAITHVNGQTLEVDWEQRLGDALGQVDVQGLPAITSELIILTLPDRLVAIDLATGKVRSNQGLDAPGNVLALPEQIVIAGESVLRGYMSWSQAVAHLEAKVQAQPNDPKPALALAHVALSVGRNDAALAAIDDALLALRRLEQQTAQDSMAATDQAKQAAQERQARLTTVRQVVFDRLMSFASSGRADEKDLRQAIYDRAAMAATNPVNQVRFRLAYGRFLAAADEPERAIEQYQIIVQDADLRQRVFEHDNVTRQAGLEAKLRLIELVQDNGQSVYARFEEQAQNALARARRSVAPDPNELASLADSYPASRAGTEALVLAAQMLEEQSQPQAAMAMLRRAYHQAADPAMVSSVVGQIMTTYQQRGQIRHAQRWLARVSREYPSIQPIRDDQPRSIDNWQNWLAQAREASGGRPVLRAPLSQPKVYTGRLLLPTEQPRQSWPQDRLLQHVAGDLVLRSGPDLQATWRYPLRDRSVSVLWLGADQVLLLLDDTDIVALHGETGEPMWQDKSLRNMLDAVGSEDDREAARSEALKEFRKLTDNQPVRIRRRMGQPQEPEEEVDPRILLAINDTTICLADSLGRVVGVSRRNGQVLWQRLAPMDQVDRISLSSEAVALGGAEGVRTDAPSGQILVLDPVTGQQQLPVIHESETLRWLSIDDDGLLIYATRSQIVAYQMAAEVEAWRLAPQNTELSDRGWSGLGLVLITGALGGSNPGTTNPAMLAIDSTTGQLLNLRPLLAPRGEALPPLDLKPGYHFWHVLEPQRASTLDAAGQVRWTDSINEVAKRLSVQLLSDQSVVVISQSHAMLGQANNRLIELQPNGLPVQDVSRLFSIYFLDRETGTLLHETRLGPVPDPIDTTRALLLSNKLVLATTSDTIVFEGAAPPEVPEAEETDNTQAPAP